MKSLACTFLIVLLSSNLSARNCKYSFANLANFKSERQAVLKSRYQNFRIQSFSYSKEIKDTAALLKLSDKELVKRLAKINFSPRELAEEIQLQKTAKRERKLDLLLNPRQLANRIRTEIKLRQTNDPNFLLNFLQMTGIHSSAQAISHFINFNGAYEILGAQLTALVITEIALTFSSAKTIAYLVANKKVLSEARKFEAEQSIETRKSFRNISMKLKDIREQMNISDLFVNTIKKVKPMAKIAFTTSLIPFSVLAVGKHGVGAEALELAIINAGFHALFIGFWSNFRYELFFGQLFPAIKNSQIFKSSKKERLLLTSFMIINMVVASETYSEGSKAAYDIFGKDFL